MNWGWKDERKSYGGFTLSDADISARERESQLSNPSYSPYSISSGFKKAFYTAGAAILTGAALLYLHRADLQNERDIYNENLALAKSLVTAPDTAENERAEDDVWSYIARVQREPDLHSVSTEQLQTLKDLLNNNHVQGTPLGKPLP